VAAASCWFPLSLRVCACVFALHFVLFLSSLFLFTQPLYSSPTNIPDSSCLVIVHRSFLPWSPTGYGRHPALLALVSLHPLLRSSKASKSLSRLLQRGTPGTICRCVWSNFTQHLAGAIALGASQARAGRRGARASCMQAPGFQRHRVVPHIFIFRHRTLDRQAHAELKVVSDQSPPDGEGRGFGR